MAPKWRIISCKLSVAVSCHHNLHACCKTKHEGNRSISGAAMAHRKVSASSCKQSDAKKGLPRPQQKQENQQRLVHTRPSPAAVLPIFLPKMVGEANLPLMTCRQAQRLEPARVAAGGMRTGRGGRRPVSSAAVVVAADRVPAAAAHPCGLKS